MKIKMNVSGSFKAGKKRHTFKAGDILDVDPNEIKHVAPSDYSKGEASAPAKEVQVAGEEKKKGK